MSTPHLAMKFLSTTDGIVTIHVDQKIARECYVASLKVESTRHLYRASPHGRSRERRGQSFAFRESTERHSHDKRTGEHMVALVDLDPRLDEARMELGEDLCPMPLRYDEHKTHIRTSLKPDDNILVSQTFIDNA